MKHLKYGILLQLLLDNSFENFKISFECLFKLVYAPFSLSNSLPVLTEMALRLD